MPLIHTTEGLATALEVPFAVVRRLVKRKKIPFLDMGAGRRMFNLEAVEQALLELAGAGYSLNDTNIDDEGEDDECPLPDHHDSSESSTSPPPSPSSTPPKASTAQSDSSPVA